MAGAVELGSGYVSLAVSTRGVGTEINRVFSGASKTAHHHGKNAGDKYSRGFRAGTRDMFDVAKVVVFATAIRSLATKGMPDLSLGVEGAARKATLLGGALTAAASAGAPVIAMAGGLTAALGAAGLGVGAFAALVAPAFAGVAEGVTAASDAQKKYDAAIRAGDPEAAKKALEDRKAALDALNPSQRAATMATLDFKKAFVEQSKIFATPALKSYTQGVKELQLFLPQLVKVAEPASRALTGLFDRAAKGLNSASMVEFTDFLSTQVGPAIDGVADLVINLGATLKNAFMVSAPLAAVTLEVLTDLFGQLRFASEGPGLAEFFNDMIGPVRQVGKLVSNVVGFVGDLIVAAAPIAGPVLGAVNALVSAFRKLVTSNDFAAFVLNIGEALEMVSPLFGVLTAALGRIFRVLSGQLLAVLPILVPAIGQFANVLADVIIGLSPLLPSLIKLVAVLVTGLLPAIYPIVTIIRKALVPVVDLLARGISAVIPYVASFVNRLKDMAGSGDGIKSRLLPVVSGIRDSLVNLWKIVAPILKQIYGALRQAFLDNLPAIKEAFRNAKEVIISVVDLIRARIDNFAKIVRVIWDRFGDNILAIIKVAFTLVVSVVKNGLKIISGIIKLVTAIIRGDWRGAWNAIKQIASASLKIVGAVVKAGLGFLRAIFSDVLEKIRANVKDKIDRVQARFTALKDWVKNTFRRAWDGVKSILSDPIQAARVLIDRVLDKIKSAFTTLKSNIKKIWDGVKAVVKDPITFIRENVYNRILVPVWNRVAGLVNGDKLKAFASGGVDDENPHGVRPGYTPGRDTHLIGVGGGEAIMRPEWTKAIGAGYVHLMNRIARTRGVQGVKRVLQQKQVPAFADGGIVDWFKQKFSSIATVGNKLKDWVLGGLRGLAEKAVAPLRKLIDSQMKGNAVRRTVGKIGNKAIDGVLDKIKSVDAPDLGGGPFKGGGGAVGRGMAGIMATGRKFGLGSGGTYPGHHPTMARARDFMNTNVSRGNAFASALWGARKALNLWYIIWNRKIISQTRPQAGWTRYFDGGSSNPNRAHTNHIHVSVYNRGGIVDPLAKQLTAQTGIRVQKYDKGGYLPPHSATLAINGTNRRERVGFEEPAESALIGNLTLVSRNENVKEDMDTVAYTLRTIRRGGVNHRASVG